MDDAIEKLQRAYMQQLQDVLTSTDNDRLKTQKHIQSLKDVVEELEIVAAAATPVLIPNDMEEGPINANSTILTSDFYASYLIILLLLNNLNDARFLWKRIDHRTKEQSLPLRNVWEIGQGLWRRDYTAVYRALNLEWPTTLQPLIARLYQSTRARATELLSQAYTTISCGDAMIALGFQDQEAFNKYVQGLEWTITDTWVHPKPGGSTQAPVSSVDQLENISNYVLHLEEATLYRLT